MRQCETCGADISHRRSNARYCDEACKIAKPANSARVCEVCGADLSHRPKAKYCAGECARIASNRKRQEWRAIPENHERERQSRNARQNAEYANNPEFREKRKRATREYYSDNRESVLAKDKERRAIKAQDPDWMESERARKRTPEYRAQQNARERRRRANDPAYAEKERTRGRLRYARNPEKWIKARATHKAKYNSSSKYRAVNRDYHRKWKFGLLPGKFDEMVSNQEGRCAICLKLGNLHVDHDHSTGQVRSLLCSRCNQAIGKFDEDAEIILNAVDYLSGQFWDPNEVPRINEEQLTRLTNVTDQAFWLSKGASLKRSYKIDKLQYGWLLEKGNGECWICLNSEQASLGRNGSKGATRASLLNVDHDHSDGSIRGLLCYNCNTAIGLLDHDIDLLKASAAYLSQWNGTIVQARLLTI